jgi:diguanylate cyclase (GGDEF)-like protein
MRHELDLVPVPELLRGSMARSRAEWIDLALQSAISLVPCDGAAAVTRHRDGLERWSRTREHAASGPPLEAGASPLVDWLARHRHPLRIADLAADARLGVDAHPAVAAGPALFAPVTDRRRALGYIAAYRRAGGAAFSEEQVRVMALLASWTGMALETLRLSERVEKLAITDDLTQVYNYRFLKTALRREMKRAMRFGQELSLVMLDVDNLKAYNDCHGHLRGSFLLKRLARLLAEHVRSFDLIAKYGGDEFTLILPQTGREGARIVAERMRAAVQAHGFPLAPAGSITISLGLATFPTDAHDGRELIRAADRALYRAKQGGRNRVAELDDPGTDPPPAGEGQQR